MGRFHEQVHGVYFDDLDPFGILHNARYVLLFERTLGSFWMHMGLGRFNEAPDRFHFVRANHVDYLAPIVGPQQVRVRAEIAKLGSSSLTFAFRLMPLDLDEDCAVGTRTVVRVDPTSRRPTPWSDDFRAVLRPWLPVDEVAS
jgi:acyl-CoA thioester hydrolase